MIKRLFSYIREIYICSFNRGVRVSRKSSVLESELHDYAHVGDYAFIYESVLGAYTSIGRNSVVRNAILGRFCSVSWGVTIGATPHRYDLPSTHAFHYIKSFGFVDKDTRISLPTKVGNDVWVGANAVIMPGLIVGDGAVIGAGAVVTKDVPPYVIVAGVPARVIKFRFSDEEIAKLLELEWWHWDNRKLQENINLFRSPMDLDAFSKIKDI